MRDPRLPETSIQGRQFPRDGTGNKDTEEQIDLGDLCLSVGNLSDALAYYKEALEKVAGDNASARRDIILKVVDCLRRQSKHEDALCFLSDVMEGFKATERRDLLAEKATLLCLLGRYGEAAEVCASVRAEEHTGARRGDARVYLVLGHVLLRVCKWKEAVRCFEQAATFARMCDDLTCLGNSLNNLGIAFKNLCRFDISSRYLQKAVAAARRETNDASLAVRLLNLANTAYKTGMVREAGEAISEAISIAESLNLSRLRVLAVITRARIEMLSGGFARARELLDEAIEKAGSLEDPRATAVAFETLGELLTLTGDLAEAGDVLRKCSDEAPRQCRDVEAEVKSRMADLELARGRNEAAGRIAREAMRIARDIGDRFEVARCQRTIALAEADSSRRVAGLRRAECVFRRIGSTAEAGMTAHCLARVCSACGRDQEESIKHLERALADFTCCGLTGRMSSALCDLAEAYLGAGRHEQALAQVERAGRMAGSGPAGCRVKEVRSRIDSGLARSLAVSSDEVPGSPREAHSLLASSLGISGLTIAESAGGRAVRVVEAIGLSPDRAAALARRIGPEMPDAVFISDVAARWEDLALPDTRAVLALPAGGAHPGGFVVLTWDRPVFEGSGSAASRIVRADYECRRLMPVLTSTLGRAEQVFVPVCICGMLSADPRMKDILFSLSRIAESSANVLVTGETGTGKELVARAIHILSQRADRPFVAQNCAALPEHLLESELFGHKSGAFTGARGEKRGLLEAAHGGVFFLDEVGDVSPVIQAKMLRAIEAGEIRRVGDTASRSIDVRFISATNRRLDVEVAEGRMRRDLYYRLNVVSVSLPPLRDREADIHLLARLFLRRFSARMSKRITRIESDALSALSGYDWPGNVRQLENEIERAVTLTPAREPVSRHVLSPCITGLGNGTDRPTLRAEVRTVERRRIMAALRQHDWNKTHAARALGDISRPALIAKMKKLGIPLRQNETQA